MLTNGRIELTMELGQIAAFRASLEWILLRKRFPESSDHILVKMTDGRVEGGEWHTEEGS